MKKTLVAIAALTLVGAVSAQSSVTLYGRIDASIGSTKTEVGNTTTVDPGVQIRSGGHTGSRWGLRGSEDLGGGLKAIFTLEQGFNVDNGAASVAANQFHRQAFVGLTGGFGSLTVGRQYDPIDNMYAAHDAFGYGGYGAMNYVFNSNCASGLGDCVGRQNNSVYYTTPNMGGFSAGLMWAPGENKVTVATPAVAFNPVTGAAAVAAVPVQSAGNMWGVHAGYANGPLNIGGAYQENDAGGAATAIENYEFGASYDLGVAKMYLQFEGGKNDNGAAAARRKDSGFQIGAVIPLGAPSLSVSYARENQKIGGTRAQTAKGFSLMAQYPLSKRTYVYAAYLRGELDPTAAGAATTKQQNYGLGLVHNF